MILNMGGISPLETILMGKGGEKNKGAIGGRSNTMGAKMLQH